MSSFNPPGTGHRRRSAFRKLLVVGAYPAGGKYDEAKRGDVDHDKAVLAIGKVRLPNKDPVYGKPGPLTRIWGSRVWLSRFVCRPALQITFEFLLLCPANALRQWAVAGFS